MRQIVKNCSVWLVIAMVLCCSVFAPAFAVTDETAAEPESEVVDISPQGLYYQAFDMFAGFFYGEDAVLTGEQNLVLTALSTTAVLFVICVPFLIVWVFMRMCTR